MNNFVWKGDAKQLGATFGHYQREYKKDKIAMIIGTLVAGFALLLVTFYKV